MKGVRQAVLWLAVCAVTALAIFAPERRAAVTREELLRSRYGGWSGVLRLWAFEGWAAGGPFASWLNAGVAAFEKAHAGIYIQLTEVSAEALRGFADGPANPPDMILFPLGLLDGADHLAPLNGAFALRAGLAACGVVGEDRFALPVAMGAYGLVYNRAALDGLPAAWRDLPDAPALRGCAYWLDWPSDGDGLHWSRAMAELLADAPRDEESPQAPRAGEGLDLGLPAAGGAASLLPRVLPEDFGRQASVYGRFVNGEVAAMPATQREIVRLQRLLESGRGPDWAIAPRAAAYTDQIALLAVTACDRRDLAARQALCRDFAALLVGEAQQAKLRTARLFPVIDTAPLYAGIEGLALLEAALAGHEIRPEAAFGRGSA